MIIGCLSPWIRRFSPAGTGAPTLLCLPHAGGNAGFYRPLARVLAPLVDVLAVQYPGRQDRADEPLLDDLDGLVEGLFEDVRRQLLGPVALFGHSMGAAVAFELARRLHRAGTGPSALFVSARRAPCLERGDGTVHSSSDAALLDLLRRYDGTHRDVLGSDEILARALPVLRADCKAAETYRYRPGPALTCPVYAFAGDEDPLVTAREVGAWAVHTTGAFSHRVFPGGHFYLRDRHVAVAAAVRAEIQPRR